MKFIDEITGNIYNVPDTARLVEENGPDAGIRYRIHPDSFYLYQDVFGQNHWSRNYPEPYDDSSDDVIPSFEDLVFDFFGICDQFGPCVIKFMVRPSGKPY